MKHWEWECVFQKKSLNTDIYSTIALSNNNIGLEELGEGIFRIWFRDFILGYLDESDLRVYDIYEFQYVPKL